MIITEEFMKRIYGWGSQPADEQDLTLAVQVAFGQDATIRRHVANNEIDQAERLEAQRHETALKCFAHIRGGRRVAPPKSAGSEEEDPQALGAAAS